MKPYFRYWGKARPEKGGDESAGPRCHPLPYHSLDVAAVGACFLEENATLVALLKKQLGGTEEDCKCLVLWLMALHDVGKYNVVFQSYAPFAVQALRGKPWDNPPKKAERHDLAGYRFLLNLFQDWDLVHRSFPEIDEDDAYLIEDWIKPLISAVTGHHGEPPNCGKQEAAFERLFPEEVIEDVLTYIEDLRKLFPFSLSTFTGIRDEDFPCRISFLLAGLSVLCDWIGSNRNWFPYQEPEWELSGYWERALAIAKNTALPESGVRSAPVSPPQDFKHILGEFNPSPLQAFAMGCDLETGPSLTIIEDLTGSGKTEACHILAHRLMAASEGQVFGIAMGLPTQATSDLMFSRLAAFYQTLFEEEATIFLAHSKRESHDLFRTFLGKDKTPKEMELKEEPIPAGSEKLRWIGDNLKKCLLAQVTVGTVDQMMLSVLPARHYSLRMFGLWGKVLVLDEIHAYDIYMRTILQALVGYHLALGGHVVLLSATLPFSLRQAFCETFSKVVGQKIFLEEPEEVAAIDYPLVTQVNCGPTPLIETPVEPRRGTTKEIGIRYVSTAPYEQIMEWLAEGKCVCWIRNTVDEVLEAYEVFSGKEKLEVVEVFHARFVLDHRISVQKRLFEQFGPNGDQSSRAGRLVLATQVIEQSLDVDFDRVVSDLAPIDLLIQRMGRQQRHARDIHGRRLEPGLADQRGPFEFWVYGPEYEDEPGKGWGSEWSGGTLSVYRQTHWLWRTARWLQNNPQFQLPADARRAVEAVYHSADTPVGLMEAEDKAFVDDAGAGSRAKGLVVKVDTGYVHVPGFVENAEVMTRLDLYTDTWLPAFWRDGKWRFLSDSKDINMALISVRKGRVEVKPVLNAAQENAWRELQEQFPMLKNPDTMLLPLEEKNGYFEVRGENKDYFYTRKKGFWWEDRA